MVAGNSDSQPAEAAQKGEGYLTWIHKADSAVVLQVAVRHAHKVGSEVAHRVEVRMRKPGSGVEVLAAGRNSLHHAEEEEAQKDYIQNCLKEDYYRPRHLANCLEAHT